MTADELLDAHARRLKDNPSYLAAWNKVQAQPPELRLLFAMNGNANQAAMIQQLLGLLGDVEKIMEEAEQEGAKPPCSG